MPPPRVILWFRNDLRLHDNATLARALASVQADPTTEVLPLFCFDPRALRDSNVLDRRPGRRLTGGPKCGAFRARFLMESVNALKAALRGVGSDLWVYYDRPELVIPGLLREGAANTIFCQEEATYEELQVDAAVRAAVQGNARLRAVWSHTLFHLEDLPFKDDLSDLPDVFTPFRNKVEKTCKVRAVLPGPTQGSLPPPAGVPPTPEATWEQLPLEANILAQGPPQTHPHSVLPFQGGEAAALARLKYYLWESDCIARYFDTRNGMLGGGYSTKFSAWLAAGCLSPRTVYHAVREYERTRTENKSTYWVIFELLWRDYFRFFALKHGSRLFAESGTTGRATTWNPDHSLFERWKEGRTGMPLVDANMRELARTGFMSNRGRQNVASYLVLDLGVDWRLGADWFEHALIDHDVTANWGNWVAAAGLTGGRVNKFNITKQSKDYDPQGDYIRTWLPELQELPPAHIHEPWAMSKADMERFKCQIGVDYPAPVPAAQRRAPSGPPRSGGGAPQGGRGRGAAASRAAGRGSRQPLKFY